MLSSLARSAAEIRTNESETFLDVTAFALGYISHVWMDRLFHPYINFHAGWRGVPDAHPDRPAMHAFLERIIDVQLLRRLRNQSVQEYGFVDRIITPGLDLGNLRSHVARAINSSLKSARSDTDVDRRISNALFDSLRYYRYTDSPPSSYFFAARSRERAGDFNSRWLSVVHPPEELLTIDALNDDRRTWQHPCSPSRTSNAGVKELFERSVGRTLESYRVWINAAKGVTTGRAVEHNVGPQNLNDGIVGDPPCRRRVCAPLPLLTLYQQIKTTFDR